MLQRRLDQLDDGPEVWSLPSLREMDNSLRCPICSEYIHTAMSLACGHTFCSECIRSFLDCAMHSTSKAPSCPKCRAPSDPTHLRKEADFDVTVRSFLRAKPDLLKLQDDAERAARAAQQRAGPGPSSVAAAGGVGIKRRKRTGEHWWRGHGCL